MPTVSAHSQALAHRRSDSQLVQEVLVKNSPPQGVNIDDAIVYSLEDQPHLEETGGASPSMASSVPDAVRRAVILPLTPGLSQILPYLSLSILLLPFIYIFNHLIAQVRKFRVWRPRPIALDGIELLPTIISQRDAEHPSRSSTPLGVWAEQSNVGPRSSPLEGIPRLSTSSPTQRRFQPYTEPGISGDASDSVMPTSIHTSKAIGLPTSLSTPRRTRSFSGISIYADPYPQHMPRYPTRATLPNLYSHGTFSSPSSPQSLLVDFAPPSSTTFAPSALSISPMSSLSSTSSYSPSVASRRGSTISDLGDLKNLGHGVKGDFVLGGRGVEWPIPSPQDDEDDVPLANLTARRKQGLSTQHGFIIPPFAPCFDPFGDDTFGTRREMAPLLSSDSPSRTSLSSYSSIEADQGPTDVSVEPITFDHPLSPPVTAMFVPTSSMYAGGVKIAGEWGEGLQDDQLIDLEGGDHLSADKLLKAPTPGFEKRMGFASVDVGKEVISQTSDTASLTLPRSPGHLLIPDAMSFSPSLAASSPFSGVLEIIAPTPVALSATSLEIGARLNESVEWLGGSPGRKLDENASGDETISSAITGEVQVQVHILEPPEVGEMVYENPSMQPKPIKLSSPIQFESSAGSLFPQTIPVEIREPLTSNSQCLFTDSDRPVCSSPVEMSTTNHSLSSPPPILAGPVVIPSSVTQPKSASLPPLSIPHRPVTDLSRDLDCNLITQVLEVGEPNMEAEGTVYPDPDLMPLPQMPILSPVASSSPISPISLCAKLSPHSRLGSFPSQSTQTVVSGLFNDNAMRRSNSSCSSSSISTIICPPSARPIEVDQSHLESKDQVSLDSDEESPLPQATSHLERDGRSETTSWSLSDDASVLSLDTPPPTGSTQPPASTANYNHFNSHSLRVHRSPVDIALAMQRPGLGMNADMTWMVNFLILVYGWVAMLGSQKKMQKAAEPGAGHHNNSSPPTADLETFATKLASQPVLTAL